MGRSAVRKKVEEFYALGLEEFSKSNYEEAIRFWEKALELDPRFILALENINMVKKRLELQKEMDEKQKEAVEN